MKKSFLSILLLAVSACAMPEPIVTDFNGSSVKLTVPKGTEVNPEMKDKTNAEATRICGRVGKSPEIASSRAVSQYQSEVLFLCL